MNAKKVKVIKECGWAGFFIGPLVIGLLLFLVYPLVSALWYSLCDYNLFDAPVFIGFDNYIGVFTDGVFWKSFGNIFYYALSVPFIIFVSLVISVLINQDIKGGVFYRSVFFIPIVCGSVAVTFIWKWMYAPYYGVIDRIFETLSLIPPLWLSDAWFIPSMIVVSLWGGLGINILLYSATLKNIPTSLYEAAKIDGANWGQTFFKITFPQISPITFYLFVTGLVGTLQEFTRFRVMSGGGFNENTIVPVWYIYFFTGEYGYEFGYASAMGVVFGLILLLLVGLNFYAQKWWVKYD